MIPPMADQPLALLLPPGVYPARVVGVSERVSKAGNLMLVVTAKVAGPSLAVKVSDHFVFVPSGVHQRVEFAEAMGIRVPTQDGEIPIIKTGDCLGTVCRVEVGHQAKVNPKTGAPYLEIMRWLPPLSVEHQNRNTEGNIPDEVPN